VDTSALTRLVFQGSSSLVEFFQADFGGSSEWPCGHVEQHRCGDPSAFAPVLHQYGGSQQWWGRFSSAGAFNRGRTIVYGAAPIYVYKTD